MLVEFAIDTNHDRFRWRMIRYLLFPYSLAVLFIIVSFFYNPAVLLTYAVLVFFIGTIVAYKLTKKVLYKLSFDSETKQVTVDIVLFDELNKRYIIPFEAFQVRVNTTRTFRQRDTYVMEIYENQKCLYIQHNNCGWRRDDFYSIQDYAKLMITSSTLSTHHSS